MTKIITTYIDPNDIYKRVTVIEDENGKRHRKILSPNDLLTSLASITFDPNLGPGGIYNSIFSFKLRF